MNLCFLLAMFLFFNGCENMEMPSGLPPFAYTSCEDLDTDDGPVTPPPPSSRALERGTQNAGDLGIRAWEFVSQTSSRR